MAQQGFQYEENAAKVLKNMGVVPKDFVPAGASHNQPDLMLEHKGKKSGCELKITAASAGSLVLKCKYNVKTKKISWSFGDIDEKDTEKQFIKDLGEEIGIFKLIQNKWKDVPLKREKDELLPSQIKSMTKKQIYERDRDTFPDIRGEIPASKIEEYYNRKDTYYVNVGTHGFYLMGKQNPLKLKDLQTFGSSAKASYRARVQYKGSDNYQFTFEMQFSIPSSKRSKYNIAPVDGKSVTIKTKEIDLGCFV